MSHCFGEHLITVYDVRALLVVMTHFETLVALKETANNLQLILL